MDIDWDVVLKVIGALVVIFGIVDLILCNGFGIDITGVSWSAWVAMAIGGALYKWGGDEI